MNKSDLNEATATLASVLGVLSSITKDNLGAGGANAAYAISSLAANGASQISAGMLGSDLANCFDLARLAGADYPSMRVAYQSVSALTPPSVAARSIVAASGFFALVQIGRILAAQTFTSRDDVDSAIQQTNVMFAASELLAGQARATALYRAIVSLHAAVTADLTERSYPLPQMVTYDYPKTFSALALAHRLYGDASRAQEIAAENQVFNPAFMPLSGQVLSA